MKVHGIELDDYTFMSNPGNADKVLEALSPHDGDPWLAVFGVCLRVHCFA
jgi:hypothetical protein